MYELKTKENDYSVIEFIEAVDNPKKREDAYRLLDIFTETTGYPRRCGDRALSDLAPITISMNQVMKVMRHSLASLPVKRRSAYILRLETRKEKRCYRSLANIPREKPVCT